MRRLLTEPRDPMNRSSTRPVPVFIICNIQLDIPRFCSYLTVLFIPPCSDLLNRSYSFFQLPNEDMFSGFTSNSSDNAGWRNVHESTKPTTQPAGSADIEHSDTSTESTSLPIPQNVAFVESKLSPSADHLPTAETVDIRTDVLNLEHHSTNNEHETFKPDEKLTNTRSKLSGHIWNGAINIPGSSPGVGDTLKDASNSNVDKVFSALLDNCDSKPIAHIENSLVQLEIDSTHSLITSFGETVKMGNNMTASTDVSDNMYIGYEDYVGEELRASTSIYEDDAIDGNDHHLLNVQNHSIYSSDH